MPTPPFALPLHIHPVLIGGAARLLDANGDFVCYGGEEDVQAIVAAVNRVAVLEQALRDIIAIADAGSTESDWRRVSRYAVAALKD